MSLIKKNSDQLWGVCLPIAEKICSDAQEQNLDINSTIYPFKVLAPYNMIDIEDWDDVSNFITIAIYNLSIYYISKNIPKLLKLNYLLK